MECKNLKNIILELQEYAKHVQEEQLQAMADMILAAKQIFVAGAGRSGFAARAFSNRLLHLGLTVHFVGEPTTPPINKGDLLIIGSGSGTTASLVKMAEIAKKQEAAIATITIAPNKTIGSMADAVIVIPGTTRLLVDDDKKKLSSIQPVGSTFEQLSWLVYDSLVLILKERTNQSIDDLLMRHANLE